MTLLECVRGRVAPELLLQQHPPRSEEPERPLSFAGAKPAGRSHLRSDGFCSTAFCSEGPLRLEAFEALRVSREWRAVVRAKGFLRFAECAGFCVWCRHSHPRAAETFSSLIRSP